MPPENASNPREETAAAQPRPTQDVPAYYQARTALRNALMRDNAGDCALKERTEALAEFCKESERHVVRPLVRQALMSTDPLRRALLLGAADVVEQWQLLSPLVQHSRRSGLSDPQERVLAPDTLKARLRLVDQLIAIQRTLGRRR
jgi:hypothetical protein